MPYSIPDPNYEELLLPGQKPIGNVVVDWSNKFLPSKYMFLSRDDGILIDYITGEIADNQGTAGIHPSGKGLDYNNTEGETDNAVIARSQLSTVGTMPTGTIFISFTPDVAHSTVTGMLFCHGDYTDNHRLYVSVSNSNLNIRLGAGAGTNIGAINIGSENNIAIAWAGTSAVIYINGSRYTYTYTNTPGSIRTDTTYFGSFGAFGDYSSPYDGKISQFLMSDDEESERVLFSYSRDPYQFLIPA